MRAIAAGCLALGLLLSACSGSTEPEQAAGPASRSPEASSTPGGAVSGSPVGSATPPTATVPEPPRAADDRRGRTAFAEYVLQAWIYALNTNDPAPLLEVSGPKPCTGCAQLARELKSREKQGWYVALQGVRVSSTEVTTSARTARVVMAVQIPESASYNEDGTFRSTNPAHPRSRFAVEMTRKGSGFRLESFSLY